jgi:hypothetical protein
MVRQVMFTGETYNLCAALWRSEHIQESASDFSYFFICESCKNKSLTSSFRSFGELLSIYNVISFERMKNVL